MALQSEASERLVASERLEGGRAASERPPVAEAAHRLTSGGCRNWDGEASCGSIVPPALGAGRQTKRNAYHIYNEKQKKRLFVSQTKRLFVSARFSAEN